MNASHAACLVWHEIVILLGGTVYERIQKDTIQNWKTSKKMLKIHEEIIQWLRRRVLHCVSVPTEQ